MRRGPSNAVQCKFRVRKDVHERIVAEASRNGNSFNAQVNELLEHALRMNTAAVQSDTQALVGRINTMLTAIEALTAANLALVRNGGGSRA